MAQTTSLMTSCDLGNVINMDPPAPCNQEHTTIIQQLSEQLAEEYKQSLILKAEAILAKERAAATERLVHYLVQKAEHAMEQRAILAEAKAQALMQDVHDANNEVAGLRAELATLRERLNFLENKNQLQECEFNHKLEAASSSEARAVLERADERMAGEIRHRYFQELAQPPQTSQAGRSSYPLRISTDYSYLSELTPASSTSCHSGDTAPSCPHCSSHIEPKSEIRCHILSNSSSISTDVGTHKPTCDSDLIQTSHGFQQRKAAALMSCKKEAFPYSSACNCVSTKAQECSQQQRPILPQDIDCGQNSSSGCLISWPCRFTLPKRRRQTSEACSTMEALYNNTDLNLLKGPTVFIYMDDLLAESNATSPIG